MDLFQEFHLNVFGLQKGDHCAHIFHIRHDICTTTRSIELNLKLFALFNMHINCSGSNWDNHVFDPLFSPCSEMNFYQRLQGSSLCH